MDKNEKSKICINSNMNRKSLYLDSKSADPIKKNIEKQLKILSDSYKELSVLLTKMSYKNFLAGDSVQLALQSSMKCAIQSDEASKLLDDFLFHYNDDVKSALIKSLDDRITYLEKKLLSKND